MSDLHYFDPSWIQPIGRTMKVDVCVYGATSAGIIAAIRAHILGKTVALLHPGKLIGGLITGGLGLTDYGRKHVIGGLARDLDAAFECFAQSLAADPRHAESHYNIGNAFFAEGIKYVLERAIPNCRVVLLTDQAAFLNLMPGRNYRYEPRNSLRYLDHIRPDYVVVAGSCLTQQFPRIWGQSFRRLCQAGTKVLLIGAGHIGIEHGPSDTSFVNAVGGGADLKLVGPFAARGQLDWIHTRFFSHGQNDTRLSLGLVVNF